MFARFIKIFFFPNIDFIYRWAFDILFSSYQLSVMVKSIDIDSIVMSLSLEWGPMKGLKLPFSWSRRSHETKENYATGLFKIFS